MSIRKIVWNDLLLTGLKLNNFKYEILLPASYYIVYSGFESDGLKHINSDIDMNIIIAIRKIAYLRKISKVDTTEIFGVVTASMERGGAVEALKQINGFKNPISRIISETLKIGYKNKTEVEESMEQIFIVEVAKMTKGLNTLKTLIELAPFLGLIGTVIGIWMTFKSLGVHPDSAAMAEGIYIALITTIAGLTVASDPYANIKVSFKPSMLDKSISNIILEKCNVNAEITESKLRQ